MPRYSMAEMSFLYNGRFKHETSSYHQSGLLFFGLAPVLIPFHKRLPPGLCMGPPYWTTGHPNKSGSLHDLVAIESTHLFTICNLSAISRTSSQV
uniref:Uncharacterized protein n=1 Tax=Arundo donax TaxID=35708 RepID=A0A0A9CVI0_ARUDO